ncbi:MAG TPA: S8 family serine peptidase [Candidatus Angelobacter sp.]
MKHFRALLPRSSFCAFITLSLVFATTVAAQTAQDSQGTGSGTDLRFHKFQPSVAPENALPAAAIQAGPDAITQQQILALEQDKASRTPAQQKIDSNVLYTVRMLAGQPAAAGIPTLNTGVDVDNANNLIVDITANVSDQLLKQLSTAGALVWYSNARFHSIRAVVPSNQIETIASWPDILFIAPKTESLTSSNLRFRHDPVLRPTFAQRAARIRKLLAMALQSRAAAAGTNGTGQGAVTTEGDATHRAFDARGTFAINGSGLKIGVLSDSANATGALTAAQTSGDMPPNCPAGPPCFTLVQDFAGGSDEGLAMMEIVYDMAPGASLFFATADVSEAGFAQNILNLRAAGCDIIVDDVFYFDEPVFQDGIVAQSVASVTSDGALYFSSAGNEGNIDSNTAGYFEGDFNDTGAPAFTFPGGAKTGTIHNFGTVASPVNGDIITARGFAYNLNWADPAQGAANDYDLFLVSSAGVVKASSTNIQTGTQRPYEQITPPALAAGDRLVVFKTTASAPVFFAINTLRGRLTVNTTGQTHGHSAVDQVGMFSVAATPAAQAIGAGNPIGPFPNPFNAANNVELFTSDGPRRVFFNADGSAITPGDFSSTGGAVRNKPDITGADGVSTTLPPGSGLNPFFGTSAAAPSAASVAALVKSANPALTQTEVRNALTSTAIDIMAPGNDRDSGSGIVMAWEAINSLGVTGSANPQLGTVTAAENPGNGNGVIEAGEGGVLSIQLKNTSGVVDATGITAALTTSTPGVAITQPGASAYPDLAAGSGTATNTIPFTFTVASDAACGLTINFTLTVNYTGGPQRVMTFSVPTGMVTLTNNLGTLPTGQLGITTATGQQTNRVTRNGVPSVCGTQKTFPGITTTVGTRTFDSYSFAACKSTCVTPVLTSGNGVNIFEVAYGGTFDPANISTNYAADAGLSGSPQSFGVSTTASNQYTIVVADVPGTATGTNYSLQLPACVLNCNINQVPVAQAHDVTVSSATAGGSANASIDNGSFDPDGDTLTITQSPAGPYPHGNTTVLLTVTDTKGATSQASAVVTVVDAAPPTLTKAFGAASILLNASTSLTFTITNPNATVALTGVGFGDTLPAGLTVATPNGLTGSCGSGTITTGTVSGSSVVNLAGGTISAGGSCTFSVNVVGTTRGHKVNTTGTVNSDNTGSGNQATAAIDVVAPDLTITKTHTGNFSRGQTGATYTITVSNAGDPTTGTVTVTDTLPNVQNPLAPTAISGTGWSCTLATLTCTRSDALALGSSYPAITLTVNVPQNIQANVTNSATVSGGGDASTGNNTATDPTHIGPPLQIAANNNASTLTISSGSSATMDFTVDSSNGIGAVTFACSGLPAASSCSFNPSSESQLNATVTMTLTTTKRSAAIPVAFNPPNNMLYGALVSMAGLLGFVLYSMKPFRPRMRLAMFAASVIVLLALAGCGSNHMQGTPKGTFPVTVTASGTGAQATVTVNLTVQ